MPMACPAWYIDRELYKTIASPGKDGFWAYLGKIRTNGCG